jgi:hypothetical protein
MSKAASKTMKSLASWGPAPNLNVIAVEPGEPVWIVSADGRANVDLLRARMMPLQGESMYRD